jgi:periplasmic mercuric ion binding protein
LGINPFLEETIMKTIAFFVFSLLLTTFSASVQADTGKFTVKGMHCQDCADSIKEKVCKMEGVEACDVKVGSITMTTKPGVALDKKKVATMVQAAGDSYVVTDSEITKSAAKSAEPAKK